MKIKIILPVIILTLVITGLSCSEDNGVGYNNPYDPFSGLYEPGAPGSLTAAVLGDSGVALSWKPSSLKEEAFRIFRRKGTVGEFEKIAEVPARTNAYTDLFVLKAGDIYCYQVASLSGNNRGKFSGEISVNYYFLPPMLNFTTENLNAITINWSKASSLITHFILEKSVNNGQFLQLASLKGDDCSYTDSDIDRKNSYSYRIKAFSKNNESRYSENLNLSYTMTDLRKHKSLDLGNFVHRIVFSPDGTKIAAIGMGHAIRVWNVSDGSLLWDLSNKDEIPHGYTIPFQIAFSNSGSLLAAETDDFGVLLKIWKMSDGSVYKTIPGTAGGALDAICFSHDDNYIMTSGGVDRANAKTWNIADGKLVKDVQVCSPHSGAITFLHASQDGTKVFVGIRGVVSSLDQGVQIWNAFTWQQTANFTGLNAGINAVSNDENYFAFNATVSSLSTGKIIKKLSGIKSGPSCFSSDDQILLGRSSGEITATLISNENVANSVSNLLQDPSTCTAIAASSKSDLFAVSGGQKGKVEIWEIIKGWRSI